MDRLPPLRRRTPWWLYFVAVCFAGSFAVGMYTLWRGPEPPFMRYTFDRDALRVEEMLPGSAMERAGLRAGDRVLSFDGLPTKGTADWDLLSIGFETNHPYTVDFERGNERHALTVTLDRWAFGRWPALISAAFWIRCVVGAVSLLLAGFVAFNKPLDTPARFGAIILALDGLRGVVPITGQAPILRQLPALVGPLVWWPVLASGFLLPTLAFCFCATFPRPLFRDRRIWALALAPTSLFVFLALPVFFYATFVHPGVYLTTINPNVLPRIGGSILLAYIAAALVALVVNYRRLDLAEQRRLRVLVAGTVVGWGATLLLLLLVTIAGRALTQPTTHLLALVSAVLAFALPIAWSYAILRHRVFDISVILRQGLQYALARRVLVTLVPALGIVMLVDLLLHGQQPLLDILRARGWAYVGIGILAITATVQRKRWLIALDRRFFREQYDAQRLLKDVVEQVREARSFPRVVPDVVRQIEGALHPQFAGLIARGAGEAAYRTLAVAPAGNALPLLPTDGKLMAMMRVLGKPLELTETGSGWLTGQLPVEETVLLRQAKVELIVPIALGTDRVEAMLLLGAKRSEEPYAREDRDLLTVIAASLAILLDAPSAAVRSDVFEECPQCGACYDTGATQCSNEGKRLVPVYLPRLLDGRYLLQQRLGRGGMGTVYAASDAELERRVAVKVVREDFVGDADAAERFRREARAAAGFAHPNVVTIHDFGITAGSRAFLVMELLQGQTMRALLGRDQRLSAARTLAIVRPISAALAAAHRRQLVHRDLKPENVFLAMGETGEIVKVLDFGLAKFVSAAAEQVTGLTGPGVIAGTPRYMSPEQWRGEQVQPAWDLWAAAVVSYELLAGAHPFAAAGAGGYARAVTSGTFTPLGVHVADAPPPWQAFFERALSPTVGLRPQSADTFIAELEMALTWPGTTLN